MCFTAGDALTFPRPRGHVGEVDVVALRFAFLGLMLDPEVAAARLLAVEGVAAHQLGQLEEVDQPPAFSRV